VLHAVHVISLHWVHVGEEVIGWGATADATLLCQGGLQYLLVKLLVHHLVSMYPRIKSAQHRGNAPLEPFACFFSVYILWLCACFLLVHAIDYNPVHIFLWVLLCAC
jgi:hypothetical protein